MMSDHPCCSTRANPGEDGVQRVLCVALNGGQTDKALAIRVPEGQRIAAPPDLAACLRQQLQKRVEAVGLLQKRRVDKAAEQLPVGGLRVVTQPLAVVIFPALGCCDDGQPVLGADGVAEPRDSPAGAEKIPKLPLAVQCGGVPDDVIVNMPPVGMGTRKACLPLRKRTANA